jgi:RimJ/RimL family protein N-acetyltransferase
MMSLNIRLRPVLRSDIPLLDAWTNDVEAIGAYNMFGLSPTTGVDEEFAKHGFLAEHHGQLMIVGPDEDVLGSISYREVMYGPNIGSRAYAIGISLVADARGKGYGTEAQRLMTAYLFATYPIMRVEASTDVTNLAEQRSLEKAGFVREGVQRQAQWRDGARHDLVLYSKLRGE